MAEQTSLEIEPYFLDSIQQLEYAMEEYSHFIHERMPPLDLRLDEANLQDRLERMFRASFPQSNGSPLVQFFLLASGIKIMRADLGDVEPIVESVDAIALDPSKFYPPKKHVEVKEDRVDFRVGQIWDIFKDIVHNIDSLDNLTQTEEMNEFNWHSLEFYTSLGMQHFVLSSEMCAQDLYWLDKGRPGRENERAKYLSYFRNYILGLKHTGSPELDVANQLTRETVIYTLEPDTPLPNTYTKNLFYIPYIQLAQKWEAIHGRQFATPDVDAYLGKTVLDADVEGDDWRILPTR